VALAALAVGVSVAVATSSGLSQLQVKIQYHNENCGIPTTKKFIGKAKVEAHKSGVLTVVGSVHGADSGHYQLQLWTPIIVGGVVVDCFEISAIDEFGVDDEGSGTGQGGFAGSITSTEIAAVVGAVTGTAAVPQRFFITVWNEDIDQFNDSPNFKISGL
jgi:hypothetical protein